MAVAVDVAVVGGDGGGFRRVPLGMRQDEVASIAVVGDFGVVGDVATVEAPQQFPRLLVVDAATPRDHTHAN